MMLIDLPQTFTTVRYRVLNSNLRMDGGAPISRS
jgi:hypothetical protein